MASTMPSKASGPPSVSASASSVAASHPGRQCGDTSSSQAPSRRPSRRPRNSFGSCRLASISWSKASNPYGAQMRSGSSSVFMQEPAEQVTLVGPGPADPATEGWFDGGIRRLQPERPVRMVDVVVLDIDPQDLLEVAAPDDQQPVQALGAHRPDPTFRMGVPFAACTGVISTSAPFEQNTSSKLRENFASWSRSRKHRRRPRSPSANNRLRACWVTQAPLRWRSPQPGPGGCPAR
jgi:hypothetical protein